MGSVKQALSLLTLYEPYASMPSEELLLRVHNPGMTRNLIYTTGIMSDKPRELVFTFAFPALQSYEMARLLSGDPPGWDLWFHLGRDCWIVDMAARNMTGTEVGRMIGAELVRRRIVQDGETVYFRRNGGVSPGRFGKAVAHGRRRRKQKHHGNIGSLGDDAGLDDGGSSV